MKTLKFISSVLLPSILFVITTPASAYTPEPKAHIEWRVPPAVAHGRWRKLTLLVTPTASEADVLSAALLAPEDLEIHPSVGATCGPSDSHGRELI